MHLFSSADFFCKINSVHPVCKGYQQTTKVATSKERVNKFNATLMPRLKDILRN